MRSKAFLLFVVATLSAGCTKPEERRRSLMEEQIAAAIASGAIPKDAREAARREKWSMPSGPMLAILPGRGVGAIRIGATVNTIERMMAKRCEVLTEEMCRYVSRGVDFHLVGGVTEWIHVQRAGRPAGVDYRGEQLEFGFFNGAIPPDLRLGMVPAAVKEYVGAPERIEQVPEPNPGTVVARDYYPGMVIEYDRYSNGKIIMGGVRIMKDPFGRPGYDFVPKPAPSAAPSTSAAPLPRNRDQVR